MSRKSKANYFLTAFIEKIFILIGFAFMKKWGFWSMKKYLSIMLLIMLISLSGAESEKKLEKQIGYNSNDVKLNQFVDTSSQGSEKAGLKGSVSASWSEEPLSTSKKTISAGLRSDTKSAKAGSSLPPQLNPEKDQIDLQKYSSYYSSASEAPQDQITAPAKIDLKEVEPAMLYFGSTQKAVPYAQYKTYSLSSGANSLWISGASAWTSYAMVPLGSMLSMIAISSAEGYGYLYEIYPDGNLNKNSYYFNPYNQMGFYADEVGQHQLFFNTAGQPSNVIVIDVVPYQLPAQPANNFATITISSDWLRGYIVYVDGNNQATEGMTGDPDGAVTIDVQGNQYHNIAIDGNGLTFSDYKYFRNGYAYRLNV
jgi:hypothetical protein